jgi:hypothetical protein
MGATGDDYHYQSNFGKVALGQVTNEVFGHVAATAAITNDEEYVTYMLNGDLSTTWDNIYAYGSQQSISKPNLANALVRTLMMYGYKKDASNADIEIKDEEDAPRLTLITKQVISQDPSRTKVSTSGHIKLSFSPGDIVFMTVNVLAATLSLSNAGQNDTPAQKAAALAATTLTSGSARSFDLKITIS